MIDKKEKFNKYSLEFEVKVPVPCPGFEKPINMWGINMKKEINKFYTYNFPELNEGSVITNVGNLTKEMTYEEDEG